MCLKKIDTSSMLQELSLSKNTCVSQRRHLSETSFAIQIIERLSHDAAPVAGPMYINNGTATHNEWVRGVEQRPQVLGA